MKERGVSRKRAMEIADKPKIKQSIYHQITNNLKEKID